MTNKTAKQKISRGYKESKIGLIPKEWEVVKLGSVIKTFSGGTPSRSNGNYFNGSIPWIRSTELNQGNITYTEEFITEEGLNNSAAKVVEPGTLLYALYGATAGVVAISRIKAAINQAVLAVLTNNKLDKNFLFYYLQVFKSKILARYVQGGQPNLSAEIVKKLHIQLPPIEEQKEIASIIFSWDRAINKTQKLILAKRKFKKALMQQLLTGKRRFKEFVKSKDVLQTHFGPVPKDWPYVKVGEIAKQVSERNGKGNAIPVLSCTKYDGLVDSLKYFGKKVFSDDTSNYKVVKYHQFAYATNHIEEGSIGLLTHHKTGLVSPMYTVFQTNERVYPQFLYSLFKTELYRHIFQVNTSASINRRGSLRWNQFAKIRVALPELAEQKRIAAVLSDCDKEIHSLERKLELLKQQKRGLMQKLLTGQIRVKV